ncbi:MAG: hypothetical protein RRX93_06745 [Bacteroidales bacterium]
MPTKIVDITHNIRQRCNLWAASTIFTNDIYQMVLCNDIRPRGNPLACVHDIHQRYLSMVLCNDTRQRFNPSDFVTGFYPPFHPCDFIPVILSYFVKLYA